MQTPRDPADWSALQALLDEALALPVAQRGSWLESLPPRHELLREPLRRLLEVQAGLATRPFVDDLDSATLGLTPPASVLIGDLVGPYRLLQQLGDGGMGSVWLAERADGSIKRKVALKLPRMVWARDLASRMARERDILGSLEHPQIARLYDAGVDQLGRPFLALEYVEGRRIDHYCDEQRFGVTQRIRLFLQVLEAVQYAHINLVLHRDLKPANVLVNQRGEIRLLDFGIAKLLDDDTVIRPADAHSRTLSRAMTPRYASPEQVQGLRLSLASDVYSLGVMLYEMLVGHPPYVTTNGSRAEFEIAIVEGHLRTPSRASVDPAAAGSRQSTPSRLARTLRGELDAVLLKALARNPADRYPSAEALRTELLRWLEGHPVRAKRPSRLLAARKFVMRNAWTVALCSAAVTAVCTAAFIATLHAREARIESRRAAATRDFLLSLFENANPELHGGRELSARELLLNGETSLPERLSGEVDTSAEVLRVMANAWAQLGDFRKMAEIAARRSQLLRDHGESLALAKALIDEAQVATRTGDIKRVDRLLEEVRALRIEDRLSGGDRSELHWLRGFSRLSHDDQPRALADFRVALSEAERAGDSLREISSLYGAMLVHARAGDRQQALRTYRSGMDKIRSAQVAPGEKLRRAFELSALLFQMGEYKEGWTDIGVILADSAALFGTSSASQQHLYLYWLNWALRVGELDSAERFLIGFKHGTAGSVEDNSDLALEWSLAETRLMILQRRFLDAGEKLVQLAGQYSSPVHLRSIGLLEVELGIRSGKTRSAASVLQRAEWLQLNAQRTGPEADWTFYRNWLNGAVLSHAGRTGDAIPFLQEAERYAASRFGEKHARTALVKLTRVVADIDSGHGKSVQDEFLASIESATTVISQSYPDGHVYLLVAIKLSDTAKNGDNKKLQGLARTMARDMPFL